VSVTMHPPFDLTRARGLPSQDQGKTCPLANAVKTFREKSFDWQQINVPKQAIGGHS
jgi:hypothetical protein